MKDLKGKKLYEVSSIILLSSAMQVYHETGVALMVNDGKFVSVEKEV